MKAVLRRGRLGKGTVVVAHPLKTRLIADAQIKTDRLDAHGLVTLLREQLALHDLIDTQMQAQEKRIAAEFGEEKMHQRLPSLPGWARHWPQ